MATLVLTAVGTAIGGPIGGAIGAVLGQAVDGRVLARPGRREGPRLTDLAVQTSAYGSQIPLLFGTMRVAGTVIWATDLIETRHKGGGGKGQPSTTSYSYATSFAVLLSARPIRAVRRIWADGNLLRGTAGDWKAQTGFRLHRGGEDQAVDPLIAAAEGAALAPAHRGCAYAVFEQLQLADFGNRIPSLTFEVVADDGAVAIGAIATTLAPEMRCEDGGALDGFAASGGSVRAVLTTLGDAAGGWFGGDGTGAFFRVGGGAAGEIADRGAGADPGSGRRVRRIAAAETVPTTLTVEHYDPARDYQRGVQRARRPGGGERTDAVEVPATLSATAARSIAEGMLARREADRTTRTVSAGFDAMAIAPGECVTIAGEAGSWRVDAVAIDGAATRLSLAPIASAVSGGGAVTSGRVLGAPDLAIGRTILELVEMPSLDDTVPTVPRLLIAATGTRSGWRQAALLVSTDDGASWSPAGRTAAPATIGRCVTALPEGQPFVADAAHAIVVELARTDMALGDADAVAIDRGANLAAIGGELVQFARAEPLGEGRWSLSSLLRGRRGTGCVAHAAGERFVLIDEDALRAVDLPLTALDRRVRVLAAGVGDDAAGVQGDIILRGAAVRPPAPTALRATPLADGDVRLDWIRRSRAGWHWIDGADVPLVEEAEGYLVTVTTPAGERSEITTHPDVTIGRAERALGPFLVSVRQRGTFGDSPPATMILNP